MMMPIGPKTGVAPNPFEIGAVDGAAGAAGADDIFLKMMAGMGAALTVGPGEDAPSGAPATVPVEENLTIKTFRKLLGVNSGETEPQSAPGDEELTRDEADILAESTEAAAILSLGVAVPTPLVPPTIASTPAVAVATAGRTPSPLQAVGEGASAAQALLAAAFAASPAATTAVSAKVADGKAAEPLAPDLEASLASKAELPSLIAALKLTPVKPAVGGDAKAVQQAPADMAAPAESAPVDTRPLQSATVGTVLNSLVSAALQPTAAQPAPAEAAAVQTGGVADAALEQQLDLAHEGEWLDRLARDIARTAGAEGGLRFRLNPENLGSLHVELTQGQAGASLKLTAETEAARAIIADAQPRLVAEARAQGVRIAETHVDLGSGGHMQSGEHRRQEAERGQEFVRTSRSAAATENEASETTVNASERYA